MINAQMNDKYAVIASQVHSQMSTMCLAPFHCGGAYTEMSSCSDIFAPSQVLRKETLPFPTDNTNILSLPKNDHQLSDIKY